MSLCDPYRELELYLEQAENEIIQVLENEAVDTNPRLSLHKDEVKNESKDWELGLFLSKFNAAIESDLTELLSRYKKNEEGDSNDRFHEHDEKKKCNGENWKVISSFNDIDTITNGVETNGHDEFEISHAETTILNNSLESLVNSVILNGSLPINAATQTSPSLSPSSTNLTWASECSSSPCLTSTSDSDLIDDDSQSASSTDGKDLLGSWNCKPQWQQILGTKSSSAPVLKKVPIKVSKQARSQSDRHLAEIEAAEACKWLRATGFPQYAQMYEDNQFPVDISIVAQDHPLLEPDVLNSLFRRLQILNSCAHLHQQRVTHSNTDESEDEHCALSDNWTYQTDIRRWSRTCKTQLLVAENADTGFEDNPEKDDVFEKCTDCPKERLRRAGSTKFRRRREGVVISSDSGSSGTKLLDSLTQQLSDLKSSEIFQVFDNSNASTPKSTRRSRTKSFDTTETWSHPQTTDRVLWQQKFPHCGETSAESNVNLEDGGLPMWSLSCSQLQVLRKLALLKLTAHMEKYCPSHRSTGWNWDLPKFIRKIKTPAYRDKAVFGVPITVTLQKTGQALPRNIEESLLWLQQAGIEQVGLFRKSGVKSRILALRNTVECSTEILNFNDQQTYDVADMVKQYFRELPEALLTNKLSETFILIFQYVPPFLRRESVLCAILLMPDEHVQVLQALLHFLLSIAQHASTNQMNESNLALCFAPSLFHYSQVTVKQNLGVPHPKELAETRAGHDCLLYLLKNVDTLFQVPKELLNQCKSSEFRDSKAVKLNELGRYMGGSWREYLCECQSALLKEIKDRGRGWVVVSGHIPKIEIAYKKVADGYPLKLWKVSVEIEAPPAEVLHRIIRERHIWDPELHSAKIVSQIDRNCEVFQFVRRNIMYLPNDEYCVLRTWKSDLPRDSCLIVETSIEHPDAVPIPNTVRGIILASRYLVEPCGSGRSRLIHLSRTDTMGKSPEWYQKIYGHICALFVSNIANSFCQTAAGPESKV